MRSHRSFVEQLLELRDRVAEAPGKLSPSIRNAALAGSAVPAVAHSYTEKVLRHAYKVTDRDIEDLRAAGWSEDEVYELTVATALNAGVSRLNRVRMVMEESRR